jgi:energy-coupling factor transporter ATP-binding protein EcfA2
MAEPRRGTLATTADTAKELRTYDPTGALGLTRRAPLLTVLDEPTASLDAVAEARLFAPFAEMSHGGRESSGVTLLISHRFSTVRMADLIVVLDGGRVTEVGVHDELPAGGGTYIQLFALQARAYLDGRPSSAGGEADGVPRRCGTHGRSSCLTRAASRLRWSRSGTLVAAREASAYSSAACSRSPARSCRYAVTAV